MASKNCNYQCRLCLSSVTQEKCIFTTEDDNKVSLATKIMICTSLMVSSNDDKPQHLCAACEDSLVSFFEFRKKCLHTHIQLCCKTLALDDTLIFKNVNEESLVNHSPLLQLKQEMEDVVEDESGKYNHETTDEMLPANDLSDNKHKMDCANCLKEFFSLDELEKHWKVCGVHKIKNEDWHKELTTKSHVQNKAEVMQTSCNENVTEPKELTEHSCYVCSKNFKDKYELRYHMRTHTDDERYKCKVCGKRFPRPSSLRRHNLIHTREKPYKCNYCDKTFVHLYHVTTHEQVHKGGTLFKCRFCSKSFHEYSAKAKHERNHLKSNKMFQCDICNRMFATHNEMDEHFNSHDSQMIWKCKTCKQVFKKPSALKAHAFVNHDDSIPFECEICLDSFPTHVDLKVHINVHTNDIL